MEDFESKKEESSSSDEEDSFEVLQRMKRMRSTREESMAMKPTAGPSSGGKSPLRARTWDNFQGWIYYTFDTKISRKDNQSYLLMIILMVMVFSVAYPFLYTGCLSKSYKPAMAELSYMSCAWDMYSILSSTGIMYNALTPSNRTLAALMSFAGTMFAAVIQGIVVDSVQAKMAELREGKSAVKEWNHTLLIGWTDRSIAFIEQICIANESSGGGVIVVLAEPSKEAMEAELRSSMAEEDLQGTEVVFRSGSAQNPMDLRRGAAETARSIVIMATGHSYDAADAATLRAVLALSTFPTLRGHVVVEVHDKGMESLLKIVGGPALETLVTAETLARMSLSAVKEPGVALVYEQLLGFDGDEFYTASWPQLAGRKFKECVELFPAAVAIGVVDRIDGSVSLLPDPDYLLSGDTGIIVVAEDDDAYECLTTGVEIDVGAQPPQPDPVEAHEKLLLVGWSDNIKGMLMVLDNLFDPGTEVHLLNRCPVDDRISRLDDLGMNLERDLANIKIKHFVGNPAVWRTIKQLDLPNYRCLLVTSDELESDDLMASDSHNLACILLLRQFHELANDELGRIAAASTGGLVRPLGVRPDGDVRLSKPVQQQKRKSLSFSFKRPSINLRSPPTKKAPSSPSPPSSPPPPSPTEGKKNGKGRKGVQQPIFCEVLDSRTQKLISSHPTLGKSCQFLVSNRLISKVMAMVAEDRTVLTVLNLLLSKDISIEIKPSTLYLGSGDKLSFLVAAKRAQLLGHILLGYQHKSNLDQLCINPKDKEVPKRWYDFNFIVIARDDEATTVKKRNSRHNMSSSSGNAADENAFLGKGLLAAQTAAGLAAEAARRPSFGTTGGAPPPLLSRINLRRSSHDHRPKGPVRPPSVPLSAVMARLAEVVGSSPDASSFMRQAGSGDGNEDIGTQKGTKMSRVEVSFKTSEPLGFSIISGPSLGYHDINNNDDNDKKKEKEKPSPKKGSRLLAAIQDPIADPTTLATATTTTTAADDAAVLAPVLKVEGVSRQGQAHEAGVSRGWILRTAATQPVISAAHLMEMVELADQTGTSNLVLSFDVPAVPSSAAVSSTVAVASTVAGSEGKEGEIRGDGNGSSSSSGDPGASLDQEPLSVLESALYVDVDTILDNPLEREVALRLKVMAHEKILFEERQMRAKEQEEMAKRDAAVAARIAEARKREAKKKGGRGGDLAFEISSHEIILEMSLEDKGSPRVFHPLASELMDECTNGYRTQVAELQKAVYAERAERQRLESKLQGANHTLRAANGVGGRLQRVVQMVSSLQAQQSTSLSEQKQALEWLKSTRDAAAAARMSRVEAFANAPPRASRTNNAPPATTTAPPRGGVGGPGARPSVRGRASTSRVGREVNGERSQWAAPPPSTEYGRRSRGASLTRAGPARSGSVPAPNARAAPTTSPFWN